MEQNMVQNMVQNTEQNMNSQMIDYYNEMPFCVNVIDKMNEELAESQKENEELKKKIKLLEDNNCDRPLVTKTIIKGDEISKYNKIIEDDIGVNILNIMENSIISLDDYEFDELDIKYIFDHEDDYINILESNLINASHEWCKFRIKNVLKNLYYIMSGDDDDYGNNVYSTCAGDIIINVFNEIMYGYSDIDAENFMKDINLSDNSSNFNYELDLKDLYIIKCDKCNEYFPYCNFKKDGNKYICDYYCSNKCGLRGCYSKLEKHEETCVCDTPPRRSYRWTTPIERFDPTS